MTKSKLLILLIVVLFVSCSEEDSLNDIQENNIENNGITVLQERDPNSPLILSKPIDKSIPKITTKSSDLISFGEYLGRSYKAESLDYSNNLDLGYPVIDLNKLSSDYSDFILNYGLNVTSAEAFAYTNFDRYTSNSKKSKTVSGGLSLNLGIFKIGAKHKMTEVFTESKISENNRVFGELNILYKKARYRMLADSEFINKISTTYLTDSFKELLYNRTPSQLYDIYGGFVLTDFITGGRAQALYTGIYSETEEKEAKENAMNTNINASYGYAEGDSDNNSDDDTGVEVGADFGIGNSYANSQSFSSKISSFELSVRTIGGIGNLASFSTPKEINNFNVDLSSWSNSLSNESTHSIIGISENGLIPLSDLMLERNLNKRFKSFYYRGVTQTKTFEEPKIDIRVSEGVVNGTCVISLDTRYGDNILLNLTRNLNEEYDFSFANGEPNLNARRIFLESLIDKYSDIYKLKIVGEFIDAKYIPPIYSGNQLMDLMIYKRGFSATHVFFNTTNYYFDEESLRKFEYNGMTYLLSDNHDRKVGFSIYDDYILDTYGIRDFVESLPSTTINPDNLRDYILIAL